MQLGRPRLNVGATGVYPAVREIATRSVASEEEDCRRRQGEGPSGTWTCTHPGPSNSSLSLQPTIALSTKCYAATTTV